MENHDNKNTLASQIKSECFFFKYCYVMRRKFEIREIERVEVYKPEVGVYVKRSQNKKKLFYLKHILC